MDIVVLLIFFDFGPPVLGPVSSRFPEIHGTVLASVVSYLQGPEAMEPFLAYAK